jgi:hypothetical protein
MVAPVIAVQVGIQRHGTAFEPLREHHPCSAGNSVGSRSSAFSWSPRNGAVVAPGQIREKSMSVSNKVTRNGAAGMNRKCRLGFSVLSLAVYAVLCGCAALQWKNADHPGYGQAEYKQDVYECQKGHVRLVQTGGYDDSTKAVVDQDAVNACLMGRGWQQVG